MRELAPDVTPTEQRQQAPGEADQEAPAATAARSLALLGLEAERSGVQADRSGQDMSESGPAASAAADEEVNPALVERMLGSPEVAPGGALDDVEASVTVHGGQDLGGAMSQAGIEGLAYGNHVAFADAAPAADVVQHELAHVAQQRAGAGEIAADEAGATASEAMPASAMAAILDKPGAVAAPVARAKKSEPAAIDLQSVITSVTLARTILAEGLKKAVAGNKPTVNVRVALYEPLDNVQGHLAQALDIATSTTAPTSAAKAEAPLARALDLFHAELDHYQATAADKAMLDEDIPEFVHMESAETKLRAAFGLPAAKKVKRAGKTDRGQAVGQSMDATGAQVEQVANEILTQPGDKGASKLPTLLDRVTYAIQVAAELSADQRVDVAPAVSTMSDYLDRVIERLTGEGVSDVSTLQTMYFALRTVVSLPLPAARTVTVKPPSRDQIDDANAAIEDFETKGEDLVDGERLWLTNNWIEFLRYTSTNPRLSWSEGTFDSAISNTIGNFLTEVGGKLIKKGSAAAAGALVGTAIAPGVGTVIGFIVGVLVETVVGELYSWLSGGKTEKDRAAADAVLKAGDLIKKQHTAFTDNATQSKGEVRATSKDWRGRIKAAKTGAEVVSLEKGVKAEADATNTPVPADNNKLAETMLKDWVLQHAGDEEDANSSTSEAQWNNAKERVGMNGDLDNRPDLFVHQTKYHLTEMGFDETQAEAKVHSLKAAVQDKKDPLNNVLETYGAADSMRFVLTGPAFPDAFIGMIERHSAFTVNDAGREAVKDGRAVAELTMDLTSADGTVYVDEWEYNLRFNDGTYGFVFHHKKPPRKDSLLLRVSPD